jgi:plasmanylethanolamine desaturase
MHTGVRQRRGPLGRYDYPTRFRVLEVASLAVFTAAGVLYTDRLLVASPELGRVGFLVLPALAVMALVVADFLSGLVHFLCDNLGSPATPVVGQKFIKSFRDHHLDPQAMTDGDFIAVNADNFTVCLPVLLPVALWLDVERFFYVAWFLLMVLGFVVLTNQAHKWAHMSEPPALARLLQRGLLLSPENHRVHHMAPYDRNYCITSGMLNPFLTRVGFWPWLLRVLGSDEATPAATRCAHAARDDLTSCGPGEG